MYYVSRVAMVIVLAAAAFFSIRRAWADAEFRRGTPQSVERAVELDPSNAEFLLMRALQLDYDGADPTPVLERVAAVDPMNSSARIRLGLAAEIRGDDAAAERWLVDAARVDRQFEPRWTLANFYFRRDDRANFWKWMRAALEVSYGDRRPAFDLCWRVGDAEEVARAIPERREVIAAYLGYLLETRRVDAAGPVALRLAAFHDREDRTVLLAACDALIEAQSERAVELWRAMFGGQAAVFRANFEGQEVGAGFDWRTPQIQGVVQLDLEPRRRISFDGREPESCELLRQTLALEQGREYTLRWQWRANQVKSGFEWRIAGDAARLDAGELRFRAKRRFETLTLVYQRPNGEARAEGAIEIWAVGVE